MATQEEIEKITEKGAMFKHYAVFLRNFQDRSQGFRAILTCLDRSDHPMTSRELMSHLPVSSARMAVVIRKLEERGFVEKKPDPADGRSHLISLTEKGKAFCQEGEKRIQKSLGALIDEVGFEKIMNCLDTLEEIFRVGNAQHAEMMKDLKENHEEVFDQLRQAADQKHQAFALHLEKMKEKEKEKQSS